MIHLETPLWKTCRVIACETRLKLLWNLFEQGELHVHQLAQTTGLSRTNTSNQMRLLAEHGLVLSRREKMNVIYRAQANAAMRFAPPLLAALKTVLNQSMKLETVFRQATGFSHGRRIEIIQTLTGRPRSFDELQSATGMSSSALSRHLGKLESRNFVRHKGRLYSRGKPGNPLGQTLIKLAAQPFTPADTSAD
jgi:DNA-binding transcriptional ArsR family regulator